MSAPEYHIDITTYDKPVGLTVRRHVKLRHYDMIIHKCNGKTGCYVTHDLETLRYEIRKARCRLRGVWDVDARYRARSLYPYEGHQQWDVCADHLKQCAMVGQGPLYVFIPLDAARRLYDNLGALEAWAIAVADIVVEANHA